MREYRFDVVRVLCMTYIITVAHLLGYIFPQVSKSSYYPANMAMTYACLGAFTFVSGYLLGKKYRFGQEGDADVRTFYKKRILRIFPLFVVASIALWFIHFNGTEATLNGLLCISPFVDLRPRTLYYIPIILWCYLVTPLVSRGGVRQRFGACLSLLGALVFARLLFPSIDDRFIFNVLFYFVGVISAVTFDWKLNTTGGRVFKVVFVASFVLLLAAGVHHSFLGNVYTQMAVGALGVFVILFICEGVGICRLIGFVSYASMACYLFHRFFYKLAETVWNPSDMFVKWLYLVGVVYPVMLALSYGIQKFYDQIVRKLKWL